MESFVPVTLMFGAAYLLLIRLALRPKRLVRFPWLWRLVAWGIPFCVFVQFFRRPEHFVIFFAMQFGMLGALWVSDWMDRK